MKYYIEAYGSDGRQILGNLDGQGVIRVPNFRLTKAYKRVRDLPTNKLSLNGRVTEYRIVDHSGRVMEKIIK